jgi:pimeloyl-ACP methyl ester carboxylesterase
VALACRPEHEARAYEQFLQDGFERLGTVGAPVLVAYGDRSEDAPGTWAARIADALPHGQAERWEGHAHFGPFADLDRAVASLTRWFLAD